MIFNTPSACGGVIPFKPGPGLALGFNTLYSKELIELLFHQPYTKAQFLVEAGMVERKTAANYLKELEKIGVLQSHKIGKENLYLNKELFEILSQ